MWSEPLICDPNYIWNATNRCLEVIHSTSCWSIRSDNCKLCHGCRWTMTYDFCSSFFSLFNQFLGQKSSLIQTHFRDELTIANKNKIQWILEINVLGSCLATCQPRGHFVTLSMMLVTCVYFQISTEEILSLRGWDDSKHFPLHSAFGSCKLQALTSYNLLRSFVRIIISKP